MRSLPNSAWQVPLPSHRGAMQWRHVQGPSRAPPSSGTGHCMVLSLQGADGGGSSSGNGSGAPPTAPATGSRSSSRNLGSSSGEKEEGKKARRQWESWSTEDKNTFFEGLYEVSSGAGTGGRNLFFPLYARFSFSLPLPCWPHGCEID